MERRRLVLGGLATLATARIAVAQPSGKIPKIGVMLAQPVPNALQQAFRAGLREHGYIEGRDIQVEYRSVEGKFERYPALAEELVRQRVDVIVAGGGSPAIRAATRATRTIPIVFPASTDPVAEGFVQSLSRPGTNATGLSILESDINPKRLQLLNELLPKLERVALLVNPAVPMADQQVKAVEGAARAMKAETHVVRAGRPEELEGAIRAAKSARSEALIVVASSLFAAHRVRLIALVDEHRLPTVWEHRQFTQAGGLVSYGADIADMYRASARYVDRILKGAKPGDLPVEQATKLELVINLRAAKTQGIAVPQRLLVRADQVIE